MTRHTIVGWGPGDQTFIHYIYARTFYNSNVCRYWLFPDLSAFGRRIGRRRAHFHRGENAWQMRVGKEPACGTADVHHFNGKANWRRITSGRFFMSFAPNGTGNCTYVHTGKQNLVLFPATLSSARFVKACFENTRRCQQKSLSEDRLAHPGRVERCSQSRAGQKTSFP